ncbi:unnamed protein product [Adineta ricciae]|uniref:Uncharacterized protein n=1 Tax=Adineta ricciae TaxID=249248 RepID=A0A815WVF2_ADIRI|nr:unnamed protein product [Adineta ricciae]
MCFVKDRKWHLTGNFLNISVLSQRPIQRSLFNSSIQPVQGAIENFIFNLVTLMNFTASGISFYIYTVTGGSLFRNALFQLIRGITLKILCQ